jgi:DNA-3-methyladenine glycosylase I
MRCFGDGDELYAAYHDQEWGVPVRSEQGLFERICLEGFQTGLSWRLILGRREQLRAAFAGFDPDVLATWTDDDLARAIEAPGVIRSAAKVRMVVRNAIATVGLREEGGLAELVWSHAPEPGPVRETWVDLPGFTGESTALSKVLRRKGFSFVGPTTCYAMMQACGLVDDHLSTCLVRRTR